jgi:DHA2 family multidrug resistance protein
VVTSATRKQPFVNLGLYGQRNFAAATALSMAMGMGLYGSAFILPLFLAQIPGYSPMQIGEVIMWAGLPQLFIMPFVAKLSSKIDNRILCTFGLLLFGGSCLMNAYMDATTGYDQLLLSQIVRALGQPFVMLTLSNFAMNGIQPKDMPSASSLINMTRNLGGSIGIALLATALTNREHFHSVRIGESVSNFALATQERLSALTSSFIAKGFDSATASDMALKAVDGIVRREAFVMAYNDGFFLVAMVLFGCIGVLWFSDKVKAPSGGGGAAALTNKNIEEVIMLNSALKRLTLAVSSPWQSPAAPPSAPISRRRPTSPMRRSATCRKPAPARRTCRRNGGRCLTTPP